MELGFATSCSCRVTHIVEHICDRSIVLYSEYEGRRLNFSSLSSVYSFVDVAHFNIITVKHGSGWSFLLVIQLSTGHYTVCNVCMYYIFR